MEKHNATKNTALTKAPEKRKSNIFKKILKTVFLFNYYYINALKTAAKYFKITPEIFFNLYSKYLKRAEEFIEVEPDLKGLDKLLGL